MSGLNIVVCVKVTLSATNAAYDPKTGGGGGGGEPQAAINPLDQYAIEEAVRLIEKSGGEGKITALSVGQSEHKEALKDAVARGCHEVILLSDPVFEGGDSQSTARVLTQALKKLSETHPVQLVLFGKQTNDSDTGQVGPSVGALWDVPGVSFVKKIRDINDQQMVVERAMEDGTDVLEVGFPAVLSVLKEINEPRIVSLKGKMAAKKAQILEWKASDIGIDPNEVGTLGSPLTLSALEPIPKRSGGMVVEGSSVAEKAKNLLGQLQKKGLL